MTGGNHVLEEVASCRRDTLDFVLSVRTLEALHRQHNTLVFLSRRRAAKIFTCFSKKEPRPTGNWVARPSVRRGLLPSPIARRSRR